jgi:hypothetical protein
VIASDFEGTLYELQRDLPDGTTKYAVFFLAGSGPTDRIPFNVIRSVCTDLELGPEIAEAQH